MYDAKKLASFLFNMGIWQHRLKNKDFERQVADCLFCGDGVRIVKYGNETMWKCHFSRRMQGGERRDRWKHRKFFVKSDMVCEICGFYVDDFRFFDVHHKDGNHKNNDIKNLQMLCPNCHRLETIQTWNSLKVKI